MTEGRHYWEVEITTTSDVWVYIGAVRPGLASSGVCHAGSDNAYYIRGTTGGLHGNGQFSADPQGEFAEGDRIGVVLDLDAGSIRFYRNGARCGGGFASGVSGPLLRAVQLWDGGDAVTARPEAAPPADEAACS